MAHIIRIGSSARLRIISLAALLSIFSFSGFGQTCGAGAVAVSAHTEGLAEKVGTITLTCTGGTAGSPANLSIFISLNANITNRMTASGTLTNITVTAGTQLSGPVATGGT